MLFFTDDTAEQLDSAIRESSASRLDPETGARIAPRWSIVLRNLIERSAGRALVDLYSGRPKADGFFVAAVRGRSLGRFDVVVDPSMAEQVLAGQLVRSAGRTYYEVWCRFQGRSIRNGSREPAKAAAQLRDYRIDARLGDDLYMHVKGPLQPSFRITREPGRIGFDISDKLEMTGSADRWRGDRVLAVPTAPGQRTAARMARLSSPSCRSQRVPGSSTAWSLTIAARWYRMQGPECIPSRTGPIGTPARGMSCRPTS